MSLDAFKQRFADNVAGKYYVSNQCLDCDLCRELSPENFARNNEGGYSYVKKQPETPEEEARCREALSGCCTETIYDDGESFDWKAIPAPIPYHLKQK
jgi:ferredoxin